MDVEIGVASADDDARSDVHGWRWQSRIPTTSQELFDHPQDGGEHLLGAVAGQELVQDAFREDVHVTTRFEQQLQRGLNGDEAVVSLVGSNDAYSDQVDLVWTHNLNGIDKDGGRWG